MAETFSTLNSFNGTGTAVVDHAAPHAVTTWPIHHLPAPSAGQNRSRARLVGREGSGALAFAEPCQSQAFQRTAPTDLRCAPYRWPVKPAWRRCSPLPRGAWNCRDRVRAFRRARLSCVEPWARGQSGVSLSSGWNCRIVDRVAAFPRWDPAFRMEQAAIRRPHSSAGPPGWRRQRPPPGIIE